mgnify:CR=1 FL=1
MKKYRKLMNWLFKRYTKNSFSSEKTTFSSYGTTSDKMSATDLWLLRKDFSLKPIISKDELTTICRLYN